ncbi:hypothetical protein C8J56DRAFT_1166645 [Mycena floridula]|nr:hypothetical protein C8J56DRAFT_1166645 [Mycena floridula]
MGNMTTMHLLTPEQVIVVQQSAVGGAACASLGYGIYLILSIQAMCVLVQQGLRKSRPRCVLLATIIVMFLATTASFVSNISIALMEVALIGEIHDPGFYQLFIVVGIISIRIQILISDLIVVWRAWAICDRRWVKIILSCCTIGSLAGILLEGVIEVQAAINGEESETTALALSILLPILITNSVATWTIVHKAWIYRCTIRRNSDASLIPSRGQQFLLLFIKSGFVYIIIWALYVTLLFISPTSVWHLYATVTVGYLLALYPVLVIILVTQRASLWNMTVHTAPQQHFQDMTASPHPIILNIGFNNKSAQA